MGECHTCLSSGLATHSLKTQTRKPAVRLILPVDWMSDLILGMF